MSPHNRSKQMTRLLRFGLLLHVSRWTDRGRLEPVLQAVVVVIAQDGFPTDLTFEL